MKKKKPIRFDFSGRASKSTIIRVMSRENNFKYKCFYLFALFSYGFSTSYTILIVAG